MGEVKRIFLQREWMVERTGVIEEVELDNGAIRYRVAVRDVGRDRPFVVKWFNDPTPAADFLDNVQAGNHARDARKEI